MKKLATGFMLTALSVVMTAGVFQAASSDALQGVFDALTAEGSKYNESKALYAEVAPDMKWVEEIRDDSIVIEISDSEFADGTWTFTQDGDCLTAEFADDDYTGLSLVNSVLAATAESLGMDSVVTMGYVNGLSTLEIQNDDYSMTNDADAGTFSVSIQDAAPWEMKELDEMILNEDVLFFEPLGEDFISNSANIGKLLLVANGSADDVTILLGEHGELDDLAYQSIINVVSVLQPEGWEAFTAGYTELADAEADGYAVKLNVDKSEVDELIDGAEDSYSYAIIHFGK